MKVVIASAFRNLSGRRLERYLSQVSAFISEGGFESYHLIWAEGDSTDSTLEELRQARETFTGNVTVDLIDVTHGRPDYGSCENPDRLQALSFVLNKILDAVPNDADAVIYVESDLKWLPRVMQHLIPLLVSPVDVISPPTFYRRPRRSYSKFLYDTWGFRTPEGRRYDQRLTLRALQHSKELKEMGSVGSCVLMRGEVARQCRVSNNLALAGWCESVRKHGYRIWSDWRVRIDHPTAVDP
jgi:hypothetical protein